MTTNNKKRILLCGANGYIGVALFEYLKKIDSYGKIQVFEIPFSKDHFWSFNKNLKTSYEFINPTRYRLNIKNAGINDRIVFAEGFDQSWIAKNPNLHISSSEFNKLNSFILPKAGNYILEIYYEPQKWVNVGLVISSLTLISLILFFARCYKKR